MQVLTKDAVSLFITEAQSSKSAKHLDLLLDILRAAVDQVESEAKDAESEEVANRFSLHSATVFDHIVAEVPAAINDVIFSHLPGSALRDCSHWSDWRATVQRYVQDMNKLLPRVTDDLLLRSLMNDLDVALPAFVAIKGGAVRLLRSLLAIWAGASPEVRQGAFLAIKSLALRFPKPHADFCLKGVYMTYARHCKFVNQTSLPVLHRMALDTAELFNQLPSVPGYRIAFAYVRQLSIHLKSAITAGTKEAARGIYNWQFINCLRLWSLIVAANYSAVPASDTNRSLRPLLYPLSQLTLGALRLNPTPKYFPLRFHLVDAMLTLAEKTGVYIPVAASLLEVLDHVATSGQTPASAQKLPDFAIVLRVEKSQVGTPIYQEAAADKALLLLTRALVPFAATVAYAELAVPVIVQLRRFSKKLRNPKISKRAHQVVVQLEANAKAIESKRSHVEFAPRDLSKWKDGLVALDTTPLKRFYDQLKRQIIV